MRTGAKHQTPWDFISRDLPASVDPDNPLARANRLHKESVRWEDVNRPIGLELHKTVTLGEKSKIIAAPHKKTGPKLGAALADNNASGTDELASKCLDAQAFGIGIASVSGTALTFCMRHNFPLTFYFTAFTWRR